MQDFLFIPHLCLGQYGYEVVTFVLCTSELSEEKEDG